MKKAVLVGLLLFLLVGGSLFLLRPAGGEQALTAGLFDSFWQAVMHSFYGDSSPTNYGISVERGEVPSEIPPLPTSGQGTCRSYKYNQETHQWEIATGPGAVTLECPGPCVYSDADSRDVEGSRWLDGIYTPLCVSCSAAQSVVCPEELIQVYPRAGSRTQPAFFIEPESQSSSGEVKTNRYYWAPFGWQSHAGGDIGKNFACCRGPAVYGLSTGPGEEGRLVNCGMKRAPSPDRFWNDRGPGNPEWDGRQPVRVNIYFNRGFPSNPQRRHLYYYSGECAEGYKLPGEGGEPPED